MHHIKPLKHIQASQHRTNNLPKSYQQSVTAHGAARSCHQCLPALLLLSCEKYLQNGLNPLPALCSVVATPPSWHPRHHNAHHMRHKPPNDLPACCWWYLCHKPAQATCLPIHSHLPGSPKSSCQSYLPTSPRSPATGLPCGGDTAQLTLSTQKNQASHHRPTNLPSTILSPACAAASTASVLPA